MRLACLMLYCVAAQAQTGVLTGSLISAADEPIVTAYVSVERAGQKSETRTDDKGRFHVENLAAGTYQVGIFAAGFKAMRIQAVAVAADQARDLPPVTLYVANFGCSSDHPRELIFLPDGQPSAATGSVSEDVGGRTRQLKNVDITLSDEKQAFRTKTDKDGRFRIEAPPGSYTLTAGRYTGGKITFLKGIEAHYWNKVVHYGPTPICE